MNLGKNTKGITNLRIMLGIAMGVLGVFFNIFVYKVLGSLELTIIGILILYFGILMGFAFLGYIFSLFKIPLNKTFPIGILIAAVSVLILLFGLTKEIIFTFLFFDGLGQGLIWYGINTLELSKIEKVDRDVYVAKLGLYMKIISVTLPLLSAILFYFLQDITYVIIFAISAFAYFAAYFFSKNITEYIPERINFLDLKHFLFGKSSFYVHVYTIFDGMSQTLAYTLGPLAAYLILKNEANVGFFLTFVSLLSIGLLYLGINYRSKHSKEKIFVLATILYIPFILFFAMHPNIYTFFIYSAATLIFIPQIDVSKHYIDLLTMSLGARSADNFYPNMIFREVNLFIGRLMAGLVFLYILSVQDKNLFILSSGFIFLAILFFLKSLAGYVMLKRVN